MTSHEDQLLTVREVSDYLRIGPESVRRWLRDGKLAGVNFGRGSGWRVRRGDLAQLVDRHRPAAAVSTATESPIDSSADILVTCVSKQPLQNPHTGVTHLGDATRSWTREEVITAIDSGSRTFYTLVDGKRSDVAIYEGPFSRYVRTRADGHWDDSLLGLGDCIPAGAITAGVPCLVSEPENRAAPTNGNGQKP
jgi:excisionase family DNA binding protein